MPLDELFLKEWATIPDKLATLVKPMVLIVLLAGTLLGMFSGLMPGLTAIMAMTLLLGFVFQLPFELGWALLISVYVSAIYAGGITAIMINIPGTPGAVATCIDGFPLAKQGKAAETIGLITVSSGIGEILGATIMYLLLPVAASIALMLGDWELALVCIAGVVLAGSLAGNSPLKGLLAGGLGLLIAMVGIEALYAYERFVYHDALRDGFGFAPVIIGLFGISEALLVLKDRVPYKLIGKPMRAIVPVAKIKENAYNIVRSALIGIGVGTVPGTGESIAPWVAYSFARKGSKKPEEFGRGSMEGVTSCEVANNTTSGGALIPTMVLGIPGSGPAAILLAALFIYGHRPGPMLIVESPGILTLTMLFFIVSAFVMMFVGLWFSKWIISLLYLPREIILPVIIALCVLGAWSSNFTVADVTIMFAFGLLGCLLRIRGFPLAPLVLGVLVGGMLDLYLRRALLTYGHDLTEMLLRPIGLILIVVIFVVVYSTYRGVNKTKRTDLVNNGEEP